MSQEGSSSLWADIESFVDKICSFQSISPAFYMTVFSKTYNYIPRGRTIELSAVPDQVRPFRENSGVTGGDVYHHIKFCLQDKIERIIQHSEAMADEDVLRLYVNYWHQYISICKRLNGSCDAVNQWWVVREAHSGRRGVPEIGLMCQQVWETVFFQPLILQIIDKCCNIIKLQRNHQNIDISLLKNFIEILNSHEFNGIMSQLIDNNAASFNVYKEHFETQFIRDAENFYRCHIISYNEADSLGTYLEQVSQSMEKEVERIQSYLPKSTKLLLLKIVEEIFLRDYQHIINDLIKVSLNNNKHQELANLFQSVRRMPNTKTILINAFKDHIQQTGINAIKAVHTIVLTEPKIYIDTILAVYTEWLTLIKRTFDNDLELIDTLKKACHYFTNNSLAECVGDQIKPPEILVQYCDTLLRNSKKMNDIEFEEKCHQMMFVFDFIEDKDIFEKFYRKKLAKRLINQSSLSDDYEKLLITKLKQLCGQEYTFKLERMIQDIDISKIINQEYQTHRQNRQEQLSIGFSVMILSSNSWPLSLSPNIILSNELSAIFDNFLLFYRQRHNGRKLGHLYQYSKGELQAYFTPKKYTFEISLYQMIVLLLFNQLLTWTVEQIIQETQMKIELIIPIINSLIKSKLLFCSPLNNEDLIGPDLHMKYPIELAVDYKNERTRINLNLPMKLVKDKDSKNFNRTINDDRKLIIQAMIVRIMKGEKTLKHSLLMQKVIEQVNGRFKPDIPMIKKCIDLLIEKEYLQRQSDDKDVLEYLP